MSNTEAEKTLFCIGNFPAEQPTKEFDGAKMWMSKYEGKQMMRIAIPAGFDWRKSAAPMLPKLANGEWQAWCPATHFGYLESGEMGIEYKDGTKELIKAGESYLVGPGHIPVMSKDAVMIEFSQDPTYAQVAGSTPVVADAPTPAQAFVCQPCKPQLGAPTKEFDGAKMWITKGAGKQMARIEMPAGFDWRKSAAPMLPKLANGEWQAWCPATHFGYLESGEMGIEYKDGTKELIKAGESYYVGPGHIPTTSVGAVMVEFSQDPTYTTVANAAAPPAAAPVGQPAAAAAPTTEPAAEPVAAPAVEAPADAMPSRFSSKALKPTERRGFFSRLFSRRNSGSAASPAA